MSRNILFGILSVGALCGAWGAVANGQSADAEKNQPLGGATVFAGPGDLNFEPPTGSVAKVFVTPDSATFWRKTGALRAAVRQANSLVIFEG